MTDNKEIKAFNIVPVSEENLCDVNKPNEPFLVFGRLIPKYADGKWTWTEEFIETPYEKQYPNDELDYSEYISNPDKNIFFAYADNQCAGQVRLRRNWNKYCCIEDIEVAGKYRRMGLGTKLIDAAVQWAKNGGMPGLMLETQDTNLAACRFYDKYGFILGGVDTMLYRNFPNSDEKALFWYLKL
ncbi:MAG: GNAT family N-acetyltransferase [Hungateiclostridium thermocellum]|mgnify:CR=1 FL=1|nr:GNAT family N-acetyltransferase [Acetivibrio thermocellus]